MALPFFFLLAAIALGPLLAPRSWPRWYPFFAAGLGLLGLVWFAASTGAYAEILHTAREYVSFIALIGSLFIVAGGIHISVKGEATPWANGLFLLIAAIAANLLGTTGASMLFIRPWIRMNKYRITAHHIVFFIFIVSNVGGSLTPIGDPPLFLGYIKGIPFWWVAETCWPMWLTGVILLLIIFLALDCRNYLKAPAPVRKTLAEPPDIWRFDGLLNLVYLAVILVAVFINEPPFLRESLMLAAALGSYLTTAKSVHESNDFNLHPLKEVAILFAGIFAAMIPALDWLQIHAGEFARTNASFFFWGSGLLSSVLDNAPTYLSFLTAIFGLFIDPQTIQQIHDLAHAGGVGPGGLPAAAITGAHAVQIQNTLFALAKYHGDNLSAGNVSLEQIQTAYLIGNPALNRFLQAVSIGAVFFGANTYIGNGPNFMVKAIADHQKVHSPSFLGYIFKYTLPIMGPVLIIVWLLFFAGR